MFTGIIDYLGKVKSIRKNCLTIQTEEALAAKLSKGNSVAVNGICLTVTKAAKESFDIDFIPETEEKTNIKYLKKGDLVNLELPMTPTTFLSGHIVQGHIDGLGKLESVDNEGTSKLLKISIINKLSKYLVEKGSVIVNGVALTVIKVNNSCFTVGIIPYTWQNTNLKNLSVGDFVNIEVDILGKYIKKFLERFEPEIS